MKRLSIAASLGAIALIATVPFVGGSPVFAKLQNAGMVIAQNTQRQPQVKLNLGAEKQVVTKDQQGKQKVTWQAVQGNVSVQPGDVLRYTLSGTNSSDRPIKNLAVTQPIPKGTMYILNSATVEQNKGAKISYSIDNGKSFVKKPTVQVKLANGKVETKPAPAEAYTQVRWNFGGAVAPKAAMKATYQVKVR